MHSPPSGEESGWGCAEQIQNAVELVEARIVKRQHTAAFFRFEGDAQPEERPELALQRHTVGVARTPLRRPFSGAPLDQPLGGADIEPTAHDFRGQCHRIRGGEQRAPVAG